MKLKTVLTALTVLAIVPAAATAKSVVVPQKHHKPKHSICVFGVHHKSKICLTKERNGTVKITSTPVPGATGATGATGQPGNPGQAGMPGAQGLAGGPGQQGAQGPAGVAGPAGDTGDTGTTGATGPQGPQGPAGTPGAPGTVVTATIVTDKHSPYCGELELVIGGKTYYLPLAH